MKSYNYPHSQTKLQTSNLVSNNIYPLASMTFPKLSFNTMILVCVVTPLPNFTTLKGQIGSNPIQKDRKPASVCHESRAIDISEQVNMLQIQTPKSVGVTQHAEGHAAVEEGLTLSALISPWWLLFYTSCLKLTADLNTPHRSFIFTFQPINECAFFQTLVENTNACTFSVSPNDVFCPLGSQFH